MDARFWHEKWERNEIGFHEESGSQLLARHFDRLSLAPGSRVFLPLCGKTRDIAWLLARGFRVAGAELNEGAIRQLFEEMRVEAERVELGELTLYRAENIEVFAGDVFALTRGLLGEVDAIFDRAALVALPPETRDRYASLLNSLTEKAPQFLITLEYDQALMEGPPFSVTEGEVASHYGATHELSMVERRNEKVKGRIDAVETAWVLDTLLESVK